MSRNVIANIISEEGKFESQGAVILPALPRKGDTIEIRSRAGFLHDFEVIGVNFEADESQLPKHVYSVTVVTE